MNNKQVFVANGALWAAFNGFTSVYLVAFALALGASNVIVGIIGSLPFLAYLITQIPGAELAQHYSRVKVYFIFTLIGRLFWIPLLLAPYIITKPLMMVILFFLLYKIGETIADPAWTSLMAETILPKHRGAFSSQRYGYIGLFGMIAIILGGIWLKQFPKDSPNGFAIMFLAGLFMAVMATFVALKIKEPKYKDHNHHTIKEFLTITGPLKNFTAFSVAFNFAFMLASPFFTVYMLKNLEINYMYYGIVTSVTTISQIIASRYVGKLTDKFGDKHIGFLGYLGTALVPLMFLLITKQSLWLLVPVQIFSGIVWAAADIAGFNLLLGLADPKKRVFQIAEYNLYASLPLVIAPILGGWITENVAFILAGIPLIFVASSILRALSSIFLLTIEEPRKRKEYHFPYIFRKIIHFNDGIGHVLHIIKKSKHK
ncbi:MAG TPA: MFS transporter [Candidatus Nanoarchaeia archaeon]|nr:MFS transporter [Candidatus Nanoarchaeia archaeon]